MLGFLARASTLGVVLLAIGAAAFPLFVRLAAPPRNTVADALALRAVALRLGTWCAVLLVPLAAARLYLQLDAMRFPGEPLLVMLRPLLTSTGWGTAWIAHVALALVAAAAFRAAAHSRVARALATGAVTALAVTLSHSGHAAAVETNRAIVLASDTAHTLAGGVWLGGLAVITWATRRSGGHALLAALVRGFSPVALGAAALVALTGALAAFTHVASWGALVETTYGRVLLLKLGLVAGVLIAGWLNWKRHTPTIAYDGGAVMRRGMMAELALAGAVVLVTAVLMATSPAE
jgi:copper transport protein